MPRLLVADDHPLFRAALVDAARAATKTNDVAESADLAATLVVLQTVSDIELVLLDLNMPGSHGLTGLAALRGQFPAVAVLVVSAHDEPRIVRRALDHGAAGFISKSAPREEIVDAIRTVLDCGEWISPSLRTAMAAYPSDPDDRAIAARLASLTEQQYRVLGHVANGLLNKQIADTLGIQERTVKAHVSAILEKLAVRNRTQASVLLRSLDLPRR